MIATKLYDKGIIARAEFEKYSLITLMLSKLSGLEKTNAVCVKQKKRTGRTNQKPKR
jgi:hypothetical protein